MNLYKKTIPYILFGAASLFGHNSSNAQNAQLPQPITSQIPGVDVIAKNQSIIDVKYPITEAYNQFNQVKNQLENRAENLCDIYIDNVLDARARIAPTRGTRKYRKTVRRELPGAPVGLHCVYGQYTQLARALDMTGDTLTIIPRNANAACDAFRKKMAQKYRGPEYDECTRNGRAWPSDSAYNAGLRKYLAAHGVTDTTEYARRGALAAQFAQNNFSMDDVNPGSILIVPRTRRSRNKFHAIMFLGRGHVQNGKFIPSADGKCIYVGFNRENIGDMFGAYDTSNVFCADIERIAAVDYGKELKRLETLPRDKMIEYIISGTNMCPADFAKMSHAELIKMVHAKYFGQLKYKQRMITMAARTVQACRS